MESMRLYPPAPQFARQTTEDVTLGEYEIPKGSLINISWEERIPRYAYLPFGGGPRICIGNGFAMMEGG